MWANSVIFDASSASERWGGEAGLGAPLIAYRHTRRPA
jgi:hypothetical protein